MGKEKKRIHAVLHTHWDREWYFTDTEAQVLFAYHMDEVIEALERGAIDHYLLDGQMSIVEDYLSVFPEKRECIRELVQSGKLSVGPWYIQMDEFLASGESCLRNLELGTGLGNALGRCMNVGYLPDSFGQSKDLPKMLNGFGIDTFVFWRGFYNPNGFREFLWKAEDGSRVLCSNICHGYFEGRDLAEKHDRNADLAVLCRNMEESSGKNTLLPVGFDQRPVYRNIKSVIQEVNGGANDSFEVVESCLPEYFKALKEEGIVFSEHRGEFLDASVSKIHRSIYSSRYDIKQRNDLLERKLTYILEPMMTMADFNGIAYKKNLLDAIWKLVIKNQAHDSLGACNSDKTNQNIENRGKQAYELTQSAIDYILRKTGISSGDLGWNDLLICNPLPYPQTRPVVADITTEKKNFRIFDTQNREVKLQLLSQERECDAPVKRDMSGYSEAHYYYHTKIWMQAEISPMSFERFRIVEDAGELPQPVSACGEACNFIENRYYRIRVTDGSLELCQKADGTVIPDFITISDDGDEGDNYDYSPAYRDCHYSLDFQNAIVSVSKGEVAQSMVLEGTWLLPGQLERRSEQIADTEISYKLVLMLSETGRLIEVTFDLDNTVSDHRMRCHIKSGCKTRSSFAGTQYGEVERPNVDPHIEDWRELGWREEPTSIYPLLNYVNIHEGNQGLTVCSRGIREYQVTGEAFESISLTLFRSVGYLGRPDLLRRPGDASGTKCRLIGTPDSQLMKPLHFEFAFQYETEYSAADAWKTYIRYAAELPVYQKQDRNKFVTPMGYFQINQLERKVDLSIPFPYQMDLSGNQTVFCSMRKTGDHQVELRLMNPDLERKIQEESLVFTEPVCYCFTDLQGKPLSEPKKSNQIVLRDLNPGQIITIHLEQS